MRESHHRVDLSRIRLRELFEAHHPMKLESVSNIEKRRGEQLFDDYVPGTATRSQGKSRTDKRVSVQYVSDRQLMQRTEHVQVTCRHGICRISVVSAL